MQDNYIFKLLTFLADETFRGDSPTFVNVIHALINT